MRFGLGFIVGFAAGVAVFLGWLTWEAQLQHELGG